MGPQRIGSTDALRATRTCLCGSSLEGKRADAKHCSPACANRAYRGRTQRQRVPECEQCHRALVGRRWDARFCSKQCANLHHYYRTKPTPAAKPPCPTCGSELTGDAHGNRAFCSAACREVARRVRAHGITVGDYRDMLLAQSHRCAVCGSSDEMLWHGRSVRRDGWHIDHDHATGVVRGILCPPCNLILGYAKDDPEVLERAASYLRQYSTG